MSRILLADDSPHAQRMGERILREEGFEVVTVTDGETAVIRLEDADPDLVLADVFLPLRSGYELCQYVKSHPRHKHARVVLLAGLLEPVDEAATARVAADGVLKKPFEASAVVALIRPLVEAAQAAREASEGSEAEEEAEAVAPGAAPAVDMGQAASPAEDVAPPVPAVAQAVSPAQGVQQPVPPAADVAPPVSAQDAASPAVDVAQAVSPAQAVPQPLPPVQEEPPAHPTIDVERVRAAVTVALDRAMPAMIDEITERVLVALGQ